MADHNQGYKLLLGICILVLLLSTSSCEEASCVWSQVGVLVGGHLACANIHDFAFIRSHLSSWPSGAAIFVVRKSPGLILTAQDFNQTAFKELRGFHVIDSNLTSFHPELLARLNHLETLAIESNNISQINSASFRGLEHIDELSLKDNNIETVAEDTFRTMTNLTYIDLSKNRIKTIPDHLFDGLEELDSLYLNHNELTSVNDKIFHESLKDLRIVDLSDNKIESVSEGAFRKLYNLGHLHLGRNKIQSLSAGMFQENRKLSQLDISGNNLKNLTNYPLNIRSMKILSMNNGNIEYIPTDYFRNMSKLKNVSLANNNLSTIPSGLFTVLPNLNTINLDSNNFTSLNVISFKELSRTLQHIRYNYGEVNLTNNPWKCSTSDMVSVREYCTQNGLIFDNIFQCSLG